MIGAKRTVYHETKTIRSQVMKSSVTSLILIFVILTAACVPSLHPLYTDQDLTMEPALIGTWVDKKTGESWTFSSSEKLKYTLVHVDSDGSRDKYDARLVKVGNELFLDIVPAKSDSADNRFIATHTFVHVISKESTVQISYMEPRWLKDFLKDNPSAIRHEKVNGEILLTSSPKETQKFLLEHLDTREAFSSPDALVRK